MIPYPSPEQRELELVELVARASATIPGTELIEYGRSVEQRPLHVVRVPSPASTASSVAPRVLVCANTHGPEFIGNRVCVGMLAKLIDDPPPPLRQLHERAELWLAPCLNPDGYARTHARDGAGTLAQLRHNHRGVDLNRNWPLPTGARRLPLPGAGSPTPGDATYRGPSPLSEPETAALDQLLTTQKFHASANLHSFMGTMFPPRVRTRAAAMAYARLCAALRQAQPHTRYLRIASRVFDTFTGEQEDHQHHAHGCWSICVECFSVRASLAQSFGRRVPLFWRFNPRDPQPWVDNDVPGVAAFLLATLDLPPAHP
ncbi:Carboxypeptidase T [Enhygromyxa salina]|uniref:Carboxypeptidase T n=1 Tax=Enhygromyxa salina TaxID=215803 RepID=A0A0C2CUT3_9BACT|nr:M14 family metallopeptidase [Enhygromyxa salina]KIG13340.1 Carboxypeptidase T [Enhygromyxa salina]